MRPLNRTFRDILVKSRAFDTPTTTDPNATDLRTSCADSQGPEEFDGAIDVIHVIFSVIDAFEVLQVLFSEWWSSLTSIYAIQAALNLINPLAASVEALRERRRQVSQNLSVVKDLTVDQYRKLLGQRLAEAHSLQSQATLEAKKKQVTFRISSRDGQESIPVAPQRVGVECDISEADVIQQASEEDKWVVPHTISTIEEVPEVEDGWDLVDFDGQRSSILMPQLMYGKQDGKLGRRGFSSRFLNRFPPPSRVLRKKKG